MPINWKLRDLLKERGGNNASEISRIVLDQTGYQLSTQAVCDLLRQPKMIRLETMQAICNSFYIRLSDFVECSPVRFKRRRRSVVSRLGDAAQILVISEHEVRWLLPLRKKWTLLRSIQMRESFHRIRQRARNQSKPEKGE